MIGDYLIESQCKRGHKSAATFRSYAREHVENVARHLSDRCSHPDGADDACEARVSHVVIAVGSAPAPPPRIATRPSMQAVVVAPRPSGGFGCPAVIVDDSDRDGEQSTEPPPPTLGEED